MRSFKKNVYKLNSKSCNLEPLSVVTTDPTNGPGDNGTATITYYGGQGNISYNINNGTFVTVSSSPFTITGLSASTEYTITVKDDFEIDCQKSIIFTLGESSFQFNADYIMLTYEFTTGTDLDTRTRIVTPDVGQTTQAKYLGWSRLSQYPEIGTPYEIWSGDNTGTGFESVLFDINVFKNAYPSENILVIDARCFWYNIVGTTPVNVAATLWKGGLPNKNGFLWENPTAIETFNISSVGKIITLQTTDGASSGERVATLTYNLITNIGTLDNNDTTTPSV